MCSWFQLSVVGGLLPPAIITKARMVAFLRHGPFLIFGAALILSGCASTADCGNDWYAKGWSDGRFASFAQADLYAQRCPGVDTDAYNKGWRDGNAARPTLGGM